MADISADQVGSATIWFTSQAGIAATILAFVAIIEAIIIFWGIREWRDSIASVNKAWIDRIKELTEAWAVLLGNYRGDIKEAFNQNDAIAEKLIAALHALQMEIARMSARG